MTLHSSLTPTVTFEIRPNDSSSNRQLAIVSALLVMPSLLSTGFFLKSGLWIACVPTIGVGFASVFALAIDARQRRNSVETIAISADYVAIHDSQRELQGVWLRLPRCGLRLDVAQSANGDVDLAFVGPTLRRTFGRHLNNPERKELAAAISRALGKASRSE
jgi:uncharacterized membrane protein